MKVIIMFKQIDPWHLSPFCLKHELKSFEGGTKLITMIAVGVGIAPMIHTLRAIFKRHDRLANQLKSHAIEDIDSPTAASMATNPQSLNIKVKLLYGVVRGKRLFFHFNFSLISNLVCISSIILKFIAARSK